MIKHHSFKHGWFYHYRVHEKKLLGITDAFPGLATFLSSLFDFCPDDYFGVGPRSSSLSFPFSVDLVPIAGHEVCTYAKYGLEHGRFSTGHNNVLVTMLEHDDKTVAVEIPLWLLPDELPGFEEVFESSDPLTGHIDCVSVHDGFLWVWDYKPNASKEKYAHVQTYMYAYMLSKRTGIPLDKMRCGYFDEDDCFVFKPGDYAVSSENDIPLFVANS